MIENNNDALQDVAEKAANSQSGSEARAGNAEGRRLLRERDGRESDRAAKAKPLDEEFKRIDAIKDRDDLLKAIAHLHNLGVGAFFGFTSGQDDKNSTMVIGQAFQGGLGMPDRDYYTKEDEASKNCATIRRACHQDADAAGRTGSEASDHAKKIMALETSLAEPPAHAWSCAIRKRITTK